VPVACGDLVAHALDTRPRSAVTLYRPIEVPTGFTVRFPAAWERLGQPFGIAARDPGQRVIVAFSGTYRAADLERHKRISESVFPGAPC
jgi:hypothetical protein